MATAIIVCPYKREQESLFKTMYRNIEKAILFNNNHTVFINSLPSESFGKNINILRNEYDFIIIVDVLLSEKFTQHRHCFQMLQTNIKGPKFIATSKELLERKLPVDYILRNGNNRHSVGSFRDYDTRKPEIKKVVYEEFEFEFK